MPISITEFEAAKRKRISEAVKLSWQLRKHGVIVDQVTGPKCQTCINKSKNLTSRHCSIGKRQTAKEKCCSYRSKFVC